MSKLLLGAHMSIAGGIHEAILAGESIGCTTIQLFTKSNRQWLSKMITHEEIDLFLKAISQSTINPVIAHAAYLINIGSPKKDIQEKSVVSLIDEIKRCSLLSIPYLVIHPGAHLQTDEQSCLERIANNLNHVIANATKNTTIVLEIMSGQGSSIGYSFEQLAYIYSLIEDKERIGFCFDTCHAWAAGYDFAKPETYNTMWHHFDTILGLNKLKVIHLNDSKNKRDSHIDRHETIGKGTIGLTAFELIMNDKRFNSIPKILETPKETLQDDVYNMNILENLIAKI